MTVLWWCGLAIIGLGVTGAGTWFILAVLFLLLNREEQEGW